MNRLTRAQLQKGFTLVEMMVVAPIVILAIGAFIATIVNLTGEVMSSRGSNVLAYDVQDALNRIEEDVKLSTTFLSRNNIKFNATNNPQGLGANGSVVDFSNAGGTTLILNGLVTNGNPTSIDSKIIYRANTPNDCSDPEIYTKNTPMTMNVIYYVLNNALWRRVVMPTDYANTAARCESASPWQQPSCQPFYTHAFCKTNDVKLINGITPSDFKVEYFPNAGAATPTAAATNADAQVAGTALLATPTVGISIKAATTIAGRDVERTGTLRASRLDTNATAIDTTPPPTTAPAAPKVTSTVSDGHIVNFTWPRVNEATSYSLEYRVTPSGGAVGAWVVGNANLPNSNRTFAVTNADHTDTVEARVRASNSFGASAYAMNSIEIPLWAPLILKGTWTEYNSGYYNSAGYTKTKTGIVMVKGLVRAANPPVSGELIATLPPDYLPSGRLMFGTSTANNVTGRVDVLANGNIELLVGSNGWFSLDTIRYVPGSTTMTRVAPTLSNGFINYGSGYSPAAYIQEPTTGRVFIEGLLNNGTRTNGTLIFAIPTALLPTKYQHHHSRSGSYHHLGIDPAAGLLAKGDGTGAYSINADYLPASHAGWANLTLQNGWTHYGGADGQFSSPQYTKTSDKIVSLKGLIGGGSTTQGSAIATLPVGFRPERTVLYTTVNGGGYARIDINSDGNIVFMGTTNSWYSLDGVTFYAK